MYTGRQHSQGSMTRSETLPTVSTSKPHRRYVDRPAWRMLLIGVVACLTWQLITAVNLITERHVKVPLHAAESLQKCRLLEVKPGPAPDFHLRAQSDRFVTGTRPTLLRVSDYSTYADCLQ